MRTTLIYILFLLANGMVYAQQEHRDISGTVADANNNKPLPGVSISIQGITGEIIADESGKFNIRVPKGHRVLTFSLVGYQSRDLVPGTDGFLSVSLQRSNRQLDEVVVVGYGTQKRKDLVGAVTKINPADTRHIPAGSFDAQLQGKAPGVQITTNTGVPGEAVNVRLRGATSINADNTPLYVVDGVFINSSSLQTISTGGKSTSPIADINPNDIATIEILKDAEATALYGSRGANGVVLVTTKRGSYNQKPKITFDISGGSAWAPPLWELTTGPEHATLVNEWWINTGVDNPSLNRNYANRPFRPKSEVINGVAGRGLPEEQQTYDRLSEVFRTATLQRYDISVAGGNQGTRYYIGGGYDKQESILKPISFDRASLKINLDQKIGSRAQVGVSNTVTRSYRNQGRAGDGPAGGLLQAALHTPTYLSPYNDEGVPVGRAGFDNVSLLIDHYDVNSRSLRYIGNLYAELEILPKLVLRSSWGLDYNNYDESEYWNNLLIAGSPSGLATSSITQNSNWVNEQTLSYRRSFGSKHAFGAIVGNTLQQSVYDRTYLEGRGFANNSFTQIASASAVSGTQSWSKNSLASFFGKVDYSFNDRYLVNFSLRADGSSKFGDNHKWGYFPSAGIAWRIIEEPLVQRINAISDLKLRASYGITGNQNGIGDFAAQGLWSGAVSYEGAAGISPQQLANQDLKWERTSQFNIGLDLGLFNDRLSFEFNFYNKYTRDGLLQLALPSTTGFDTYWSNAAEISNKGFELGIRSVNIVAKEFRWTTGISLAQNINKIEKLATPLQYGSRNLILQQEGSPLYSYWLYKQLYVDPETGKAVYEDVNKDNAITAADRQVIGSVWPKLFGGISNDFSFRNFDLGIFFSFQYGNDTYNHNRFFGEGGGARDAARVIFANNLKRWQQPGDKTDVPRSDGVNVNNYLDGGSRWLEDGSFLRLRSLSLGYTIPKKIVSRIRFENIRLYCLASNLFLLTSYSGPDPESSANSSQNQPGIDLGTPPQPRSVQFGINVTL
ncbi:SusC/RagA family TonB-linked outer membrane protein [Flavihumibacter solisilvae]|uniref:Collagen-binding protein n=1 Tax=Flavihumibacter solisilvae TaxID=1349421 RepID=A0A0C1KSR6_9BACT|nr:TonB-dependent receptor [Flavihumibacter solisilvae]KIC90742.1 collagen-binding protein [Flavihumibacter solisilvae]